MGWEAHFEVEEFCHSDSDSKKYMILFPGNTQKSVRTCFLIAGGMVLCTEG